MASRATSLAVLAVALLATGFGLGRLTAPAAPVESVGLIAPTGAACADRPEEASRGPELHPAQRPPQAAAEIAPAPPPPTPLPEEKLEIEGEGDAARVHVKGGAYKVAQLQGRHMLVRDGPWTTWHPDGAKATEATYRGGVLEGAFTSWHESGEINVRTTYQGGRSSGSYRSFHSNGARHVESEYREGVPAGLYRAWHPNGELQHEFTYQHGKAHGLVRTWHSNGQLALSGYQEMGTRDGVWTGWDEQGTKRSEETWRLGVREGDVRLFDENGDEVSAARAAERATVGGKYSELLKTIPAPHDYARYKDFKDYGWYRALRSYAGVKDIPAGHWVYAYPNWYIWAQARGVERK